MTVISNPISYQLVESPLNEYYDDELIHIDYSDLPPDAVQKRMFFILGFAVACVLIFSFLVIPRWFTGDGESSRVAFEPAAPAVADVQTNRVVPMQGQISAVFSPEVKHWEAKIISWAATHQVDPNAVATIMQIESCGDPKAISSAGAQGLFQVMPFHFVGGEDMLDPDTNARRGVAYFAEQLARFEDTALAFAAYNGGPGNAVKNKNAWPSETQRYYYWGSGIYNDVQAGLTNSPRLQEWLNAGGSSLCKQASARLGL